MNLKEEQEKMYERHREEANGLLSKAIKELAQHELDVIASGHESYNDDGGIDYDKSFSIVRKDLKNQSFNKKEVKDFQKFLSENGLDFNLESMFGDFVECGFEKNVFYKFVTSESGEMKTEADFSDEVEEIYAEILGLY